MKSDNSESSYPVGLHTLQDHPPVIVNEVLAFGVTAVIVTDCIPT